MFFLLPVGTDYSARRYPVVTLTLIGVNVAVYLAGVAYVLNGGVQAALAIRTHFWLIPKLSLPYTYVTSWFVHAGLFHLLGNMVYLFLFGACVEDMIGRWQFALFYALGGFAADFGYIAAAPGHFDSILPMGGASGAINACIAGFLVLLVKAQINVRWFVWFLRPFTGDFWLSAWIMIAIRFGLDFISMVVAASGPGNRGGVAYGAHVGGFIGGLAVAGILRAIHGGEHVEDAREKRSSARATRETVEAAAIAEAADVFLHENGAQIGPFTESQARRMVALGSVANDALYWRDGMAEWRPAVDL